MRPLSNYQPLLPHLSFRQKSRTHCLVSDAGANQGVRLDEIIVTTTAEVVVHDIATINSGMRIIFCETRNWAENSSCVCLYSMEGVIQTLVLFFVIMRILIFRTESHWNGNSQHWLWQNVCFVFTFLVLYINWKFQIYEPQVEDNVNFTANNAHLSISVWDNFEREKKYFTDKTNLISRTVIFIYNIFPNFN